MTDLFRRDFCHGIDVSRYQQDRVDYERVAEQGVMWCMIGVTQGQTHVSPARDMHTLGCARASILHGGYHFATPGPDPRDAILEARHFVRVLRDLPVAPNLRPALDLEVGRDLGAARLTRWVLDFCEEVEALVGFAPMLYAGKYLRYIDADKVAHLVKWVSHYLAKDGTPWGGIVELRDARIATGLGPSRPTGVEWHAWQWTSEGRVEGIRGHVDLNIAPAIKPLLAPRRMA